MDNMEMDADDILRGLSMDQQQHGNILENIDFDQGKPTLRNMQ